MKKRLLAIMMMIVMVALVGCTNGDTSENNETTATRIIQDVRGEVEIPANPERIVDLSGASDILSILGYQVVGTANSDGYDYTRFPSYLENELEGATILGYSMQDQMDIERIFSLNPDLIIISTVQEKMYDQLSQVAPTVMIEMAQVDWKVDFIHVATVMGNEEEATEWVTNYDAKAEEVGKRITEAYGEETSYLSFLASGGSIFIFDGAGVGSILYQDMGLKKPVGMPEQENISLPVVSYEGLASIEADVIFAIGVDEDLALLNSSSIFNGMDGVKEGKVIELPASPYFNIGYSPIGRMVFLDEVEALLDSIA